MYNIALVQNQDQMAYASKVDVRNLIRKFGYNPILYTGHNIDILKSDLASGKFEAILLSSNCLSEKLIFQEIFSDAFKQSLLEFLEKGKGCLVFHQNALANLSAKNQGGTFNFLPHPFDTISTRKRPSEESNASGKLITTRLAQFHPSFIYPNKVNVMEFENIITVDDLRDYCAHKGLLYMNYLEMDSTSYGEIDTLIFDTANDGSRRTLLIASQQNSEFRIVVSSMNLDWQKEEKLFNNLLTYVIEGPVHTAVIRDRKISSIAFDFLMTTLRSEKYRFREYDITEFSDLRISMEDCIQDHKIFLMGPCSEDNRKILDDTSRYLESKVQEGRIKLIGFEDTYMGSKKVYILGQEKVALSTLYDTELKIQREIKQYGFVDNGFWNTVETLKTIDKLKNKGYCYSTFGLDVVNNIFATSNKGKHLKIDGSYDELLNPSVALLWLRVKYFGADSEDSKRTLNWIRTQLPREEKRERIFAYTTFLEFGLILKSEIDELQQLIKNANIDSLSEIDIIYYLRASIAMSDIDSICRFIKLLTSVRNEEKIWIDTSISASIVIILLEALPILRDHVDMRNEIEEMIFSTILHIQREKEKAWNNMKLLYPWGNKASTTIKCIYSILSFEELLDMPVESVRKILLSYSGQENKIDVEKTALSMIEEFKKDIRDLNMDRGNLLKKFDEKEKELTDERTKLEDMRKCKDEQDEHIKDLKMRLRDNENAIETNKTIQKVLWFLAIAPIWLIIFFVSNKTAREEALSFVSRWWNFIGLSFVGSVAAASIRRILPRFGTGRKS